ncbi:MAG: hypothetical protein AAF191_04460 [Verrucomicrobiota bacterium]
MATELSTIASKYTDDLQSEPPTRPIPAMKSVRLAVNVASCDGLPCLLVIGRNETELTRLNAKLGAVIWEPELAGQFICASTTQTSDLSIIKGDTPTSGYLIVRPDAYGLEGEAIASIQEPASATAFTSSLLEVAANYQRLAKSHGQHVRQGRQSGISWDTEVAVPERRRVRPQ